VSPGGIDGTLLPFWMGADGELCGEKEG